jgi:hypothetical protein
MDTYMVESPHTEQECMQAMEQAVDKKTIGKFEWGCMSGEHVGFAKVKAGSEEDAKKVVPDLVRRKARAVKVGKISARDLKKAHDM